MKARAVSCARTKREPTKDVTGLGRTSGSSVEAPHGGLPTARRRDEISLDLIIPAHNEAHRIGPTLEVFRRDLSHPDMRFIVALDNCEDATPEIVARHAREDPRVEIQVFPKLGKGGVIRQAFHRCRADLVAFVDADGSTAPEQLAQLVDAVQDADGAIASRRLPSSSVHGSRAVGRVAASILFAWLVRHLFELPYRDTQCGAKLIRREALELLLPLVTTSGYLFDVDLLLQAAGQGYRIVEVPTVWVARPGSRVRLIRDLGDVTGSLFWLWMSQQGAWKRPLPTWSEPLDRGRSASAA
jgi:glycosyltransferase involved in cell wall biosynthesis